MPNFARIWRKYFFFAGIFSLFQNILYLSLPVYMLVIYDRVLFSYSESTLYTLSVGAVFSLIILGLFELLRSRLLVQAGIETGDRLAEPVFKQMHYLARSLNAQGYSQGMQDLKTLRQYLGGRYIQPFFDLPWVPVFIIVLYFMHSVLGYLALVGVIALAVLAFLQHVLVRNRLRIAEVASFQGQGLINKSLDNIELVFGLGMFRWIMDRWQELSERVTRLEVESGRFSGAILSVIKPFRLAMQIAVYGAGAHLFFINEISAGMMIASVIIVHQALSPVEETIASWKETVLAGSAHKRLKNCLQAEQAQETMSLPVPEGRLDVEAAALALESRYVLRNISVSLQPGEHLGIIGPSASGKTVLSRLIIGHWPPLGGKVRLDGADIQQWDRQELAGYVGYLPQETELFPGTVSENIARMGPVDSNKVIEAAKKAGAHQMILNLAQGYDTIISPDGRNLSAGQRRRIALARALYDDPVLAVLDEPEIGLDDEGERAMINCLMALKKSGTTVVIATHKPRLIGNVDKLLFLKEGQVSMLGPRQEVLNKLKGQQQQAQSGSG